jgi:hypothetical protein
MRSVLASVDALMRFVPTILAISLVGAEQNMQIALTMLLCLWGKTMRQDGLGESRKAVPSIRSGLTEIGPLCPSMPQRRTGSMTQALL